MSVHRQYQRTIVLASIRDASYQVRKFRVLEGFGGRHKRKTIGRVQIMTAGRDALELDTTAIEEFVA
ncbi:MAG: hypothetical protein H8E44_35590 [Planctomycetes bacterium]|nr:hypothetical protein [Planctomycetota bacterium]MBL7043533.1 hypothetical protein [Pirellulaceae bacterium]